MEEITRLFDFPYYQLKHKPNNSALVTKYGNKWVKTSTKEYVDKANAISRALLKLGVKTDDKIAVISTTNRTEWNIVDIESLKMALVFSKLWFKKLARNTISSNGLELISL